MNTKIVLIYTRYNRGIKKLSRRQQRKLGFELRDLSSEFMNLVTTVCYLQEKKSFFKVKKKKESKDVYQYPIVMVGNNYKFSGLKHKCIILQTWSSEV